jgi:hypothetical protein
MEITNTNNVNYSSNCSADLFTVSLLNVQMRGHVYTSACFVSETSHLTKLDEKIIFHNLIRAMLTFSRSRANWESRNLVPLSGRVPKSTLTDSEPRDEL